MSRNLLIDISRLSCSCTDGALEYIHKAMAVDDDNIWREHENAFIRNLVERMSNKGTMAFDAMRDEMMRFLDEDRVPVGRRSDRPTSNLVKWSEEQLHATWIYLSALSKDMWQTDDYNLLVDYLVQRYFPDDPSNMADYYIRRAILAGRIQASAEDATEEEAMEYLFHFEEEEALKTAERRAGLNQAVIDYGVNKCADLIQDVTETTRHKLKNVILEHQKEEIFKTQPKQSMGEISPVNEKAPATTEEVETAEPPKAKSSLQTKLFDAFADLNRDWRRIAITEIGENANQGFIASMPVDSKVKRIEQYKNACAFCQKWNGKVLTVVAPDKKDKNWDTEVWVGKTNYGRSVSPYKRVDGRLIKRTDSELWKPSAGLFHPHCRGIWVRAGNGNPDDFSKWLDGFLQKVN